MQVAPFASLPDPAIMVREKRHGHSMEASELQHRVISPRLPLGKPETR